MINEKIYQIMIVEDDEIIAEAMKKQLESWGYNVNYVKDFKEVMQTFTKTNPQLVLMDISLPFYNGYHWCNEIRKISKVPIIFVSSASDNMNIVMAMNMGGDDFIAKPFDLDVLMAKIQAILRRTYDFTGSTDFVEYKGLLFYSGEGFVVYQGQKLELTKNELRILHVLLENRGNLVSRERLMEKLWQTDSFVDDNTLTVNVARLRKKLEEIGAVDYIKTKKGVGYYLE